MAGRDRGENSSFYRLGGDLSLAPLADRAVGAFRDFTRQGDRLAELLRREVGGSSRTRGVGKACRHVGGRVGVRRAARQPALAPQASHIEAHVELAGDLGIVEAV